MEEIKGCITDEDVLEVVRSIRKDIVPLFKDYKVGWGKILLRIINTDPIEETRGGLKVKETVNELDVYTQGITFMQTHPFQAVVLGVGEFHNGEGYQLAGVLVEPGDHVIIKEIDKDNLQRNGLVVKGYSLCFGYINDIHLVVPINDKEGPARSTSDTGKSPRESEPVDIKKGNKK
jgi:hypothetical protein